jgi:pyrroloquinoline quinone biosynthesis protein E
MNGWGSIFLDIAPDGAALPCHNARELPGLNIPNVKEHSIREIWVESQAFNFFRGDSWMQEPCRSCSEKEKDFGGCRCQAFLLTGDAAATDPVCSKSPKHHIVKQVINEAALINKSGQPPQTEHPLVFRTDKNSRLLSDAKR